MPHHVCVHAMLGIAGVNGPADARWLGCRDAGLVLQRAEDMPSPDDVIEAHAAAKGGAEKQARKEDPGEEKLDPIEAGWDDELGKPEDTPAIDFLGE